MTSSTFASTNVLKSELKMIILLNRLGTYEFVVIIYLGPLSLRDCMHGCTKWRMICEQTELEKNRYIFMQSHVERMGGQKACLFPLGHHPMGLIYHKD